MSYSVYMHTTPSGKRYIGVTKRKPEVRWQNGVGYQTQTFGRAVAKYGWENISHEVLLDDLSKDEADFWERFFISTFRTTDPCFGYNVEAGGSLGKEISAETRQKISNANKGEKNPNYGKQLSEERRQKISESWKSRTVSEETRKKISDSLKGEKNPNYGKPHSEETRQKIRAAALGRTVSLETRAKISESRSGERHPMYGKHLSEEHRRKLSEAQRGEKSAWYGKQRSDEHCAKIREVLSKRVINLDTGEVFESITTAGEHYSVSRTAIGNCASGRTKTAGGQHWAYI